MLIRSVKAAIVYFVLVFAVGFVLGTLRVLALEPMIGEVGAVIAETPIMLVISWLVCAGLIRRYKLPRGLATRLTMGGSAFVFLMSSEFGLSVLLLGRTLSEYFAHYETTAGMIGLFAQLAFALFPTIQTWTEES